VRAKHLSRLALGFRSASVWTGKHLTHWTNEQSLPRLESGSWQVGWQAGLLAALAFVITLSPDLLDHSLAAFFWSALELISAFAIRPRAGLPLQR